MRPNNSKIEIHAINFRDELFFEIEVTDIEGERRSVKVTLDEAEGLISSLAERIKYLKELSK